MTAILFAPPQHLDPHPTPQHIMMAIFDAIETYNASQPATPIPYAALIAVRQGVRVACQEHEDAKK